MSEPGALDAADFHRALMDLLPQGWAWPRDPETTLSRFWAAVAVEAARLQDRAAALLDESHPCGANELLPDWERALGLPDPCAAAPGTIALRQAAVCARLAARGGQSIAFLEAALAAIGVTATLGETRPFRAGHAGAGGALTNDPWRFTVVVQNGDGIVCTPFLAGAGTAGEPLDDCVDLGLVCLLTRIGPAHVTYHVAS